MADTNPVTGTGGSNINAIFDNKKKDSMVSADDFLLLMVAQLQNQDFMNPVDDTQYVTQLAQFASMQQMQEMAAYMQTNYALSLVGQTVTASRYTVSGALETETGTITKMSLLDGEFTITVNGKNFTMAQIMEYHNGPVETDTGGGDGDGGTGGAGDGDGDE